MNWEKVIFMAHASEDKAYVRQLYHKLKNNGLEPWLDEENLLPGVNWDNNIKEAIRNSRFFLMVLSSNSVSKSGYIQKELRMALKELEQKASDVIYFIPALIEDVELPNITVGTINLTDYQAAKIYNDEGQQKLIEYLRQQVNIVVKVKRKENPTFKKLKTEISKGQIESALEKIREYVQLKDNYMLNETILLTSRFNSLKTENIMGTINNEQYSIQNNKIVYSILELIKLLEEKEKG